MGSGFGALQRAPHPHCARLQTLLESCFRVCYLGLRNVVGGHPLYVSFSGKLFEIFFAPSLAQKAKRNKY
jgi:hypothetical protein